jgi:L-fuconolactonase
MEVIDAQVHEPAPWEPWPPGQHQSHVALSSELLLASMDAAGVDIAVLTTVRPALARYACATFPNRFAYIREYDSSAPNIEELVATTLDDPGALGVRIYPAFTPGGMDCFRDGGYDRMLSAADKHHVPVFAFISGHLPEFLPVPDRHPELPIIIDHIGLTQPPHEADSPPFRRLPELLAFAQFRNVSVKLSGLPTLSPAGYPFDDLWPHIHRIIEAFGAYRVMWGSDIQRCRAQMALEGPDGLHEWNQPASPGRHNYAEAVNYVKYSSELDETTKAALLGGTIRSVLGWPSTKAAIPEHQIRSSPQTTPAVYDQAP